MSSRALPPELHPTGSRRVRTPWRRRKAAGERRSIPGFAFFAALNGIK
jgi:hypothetical protein